MVESMMVESVMEESWMGHAAPVQPAEWAWHGVSAQAWASMSNIALAVGLVISLCAAVMYVAWDVHAIRAVLNGGQRRREIQEYRRRHRESARGGENAENKENTANKGCMTAQVGDAAVQHNGAARQHSQAKRKPTADDVTVLSCEESDATVMSHGASRGCRAILRSEHAILRSDRAVELLGGELQNSECQNKATTQQSDKTKQQSNNAKQQSNSTKGGCMKSNQTERNCMKRSRTGRNRAGARRRMHDHQKRDCMESSHAKRRGRADAQIAARRQSRRALSLHTVRIIGAMLLTILVFGCAWLAVGLSSPRSHAHDVSDSALSREGQSSASHQPPVTAGPSDGATGAGGTTQTSGKAQADASADSQVSPGGHNTSGTVPTVGVDAESSFAGYAVRAHVDGIGRKTGPVAFNGNRAMSLGKDGSPAELRITVSVSCASCEGPEGFTTSADAGQSSDASGPVSRPDSTDSDRDAPVAMRLHVPAPTDASGNALGLDVTMEKQVEWVSVADNAKDDANTEDDAVDDAADVPDAPDVRNDSSASNADDATDGAGKPHGARGMVSFSVTAEGMYSLPGFTVDVESTQQRTTYALSRVLADSDDAPDYDAVIIDQGETLGRGLEVNVVPVADPSSGEVDSQASSATRTVDGSRYYFSSPVEFALTVTDRWFAFYQAAGSARSTEGTVRETDNEAATQADAQTGALAEIIARVSDGSDPSVVTDWAAECVGGMDDHTDADSTQQGDAEMMNGDGGDHANQWRMRCALGGIQTEGMSALREGTYRYTASYQGLLGTRETIRTCHDADAGMPLCEFVVDMTSPTIGSMRVDGAYEHVGGWVRVHPGFRIIADGLADERAGLADAQLGCMGAQQEYADAQSYPATPLTVGMEGDAAFVEFPRDAYKWDLSRLGMTVRDHAGNSTVMRLSDALVSVTGQSSTGAMAVVMEPEAPSSGIVHEECAHAVDQSATHESMALCSRPTSVMVHIDDVALEAIQWSDPGRVIGVASVDGRVVRSIVARELQLSRPPQAPDGVFPAATPVARVGAYSFLADTDGLWEIDVWAASLANGQDLALSASHVSFIVDMTQPRLDMELSAPSSVPWNAQRDGRYFNSDVHMSLECVERNAQDGVARLVIEGQDTSGNPVSVIPELTWDYVGDSRWRASYSWHQEGSFAVRLEAVDKAGNQARTVMIPKFVLDSTQPSIHIDGVEDSHAYSGSAAISIRVDEPMLDGGVDWSLSGVRRGAMQPAVDAQADRTGMTLALEDFSTERDFDDVYDLRVSAHDKAGNVAERHVRFSINRFGSTYAFSEATERAHGAYLREATDMEIDEINVSGIAPESVQIRVVRGDSVRSLAEGEYRRLQGDSNGWGMTRYVIPGATFSEDGWYRVLVSSTDAAGNHSDNARLGVKEGGAAQSSAELSFAVDSTPPQVHVGASGSVHMHDAMMIDHAQLFVDGTAVRYWEGDAGDGTVADVPADGNQHDVSVVAVDKAGNTAEESARVQSARRGWSVSIAPIPPLDSMQGNQATGMNTLLVPLGVAIGVPLCAIMVNRIMHHHSRKRRHGTASHALA